MSDIHSLLKALGPIGYLDQSSVYFNNLRYPIRSLVNGLNKFCHALIQNSDSEGRTLSTKGSATFVEHSGRFFAIITKHQYEKIEPSEVCFFAEGEQRLAMGGNFFIPLSDESYGDELCYLDLSQHVLNGTLATHQFLSLASSNICEPGDNIGFGTSFGFLFDDQVLEYDETGEADFEMMGLHTKLREYNVKYLGQSISDSLCKWSRTTGLLDNLNGFSGGPTFALIKENDGFHAKLAGINMASNGSILHTVKVDTLKRYLNTISRR